MGGMIDNTLAANVPQFNLANTLQQGAQAQAAQDAVQQEQLKAKQNAIGSEMRGLAPFADTADFPAKWKESADRLLQNGTITQQTHDQWANSPSPLMMKSAIASSDSPEIALQKQQQDQSKINADRNYGLAVNADKRAATASENANMTPLEQAKERAKAADFYKLPSDSPGYQSFVLGGGAPAATASRPLTAEERSAYKVAPDAAVAMTATGPKAIGGPQTSVINNVDMNSGQTYDKQLAEGLGKSHAGLANGVEDAQSRARDIAAMQGAVDAIQKNGGTTGGLAPAQRLEIQKSINAGASALGIEKPFDEGDLSDKEFLTKFNRSMAGAQAKNAVGSRVTNFEMSNFLKANPGLDMTVTGNQRLLGIQAQIEQRNIAVGNAIRNATAEAISKGQKIDPVTVQKIVTDYDQQHHVKDPVSGQDLTQSVALPEFQQGGTNHAAAVRHDANIGKIRKYNPVTGALD